MGEERFIFSSIGQMLNTIMILFITIWIICFTLDFEEKLIGIEGKLNSIQTQTANDDWRNTYIKNIETKVDAWKQAQK